MLAVAISGNLRLQVAESGACRHEARVGGAGPRAGRGRIS
jgi:hypothetical protein